MKAHLINMHLLVPRSRSSAKVKVKCKGYISQIMAVSGHSCFTNTSCLSIISGKAVITTDGLTILESVSLSHPVANVIALSLTKCHKVTFDGSKTFLLYLKFFVKHLIGSIEKGNFCGVGNNYTCKSSCSTSSKVCAAVKIHSFVIDVLPNIYKQLQKHDCIRKLLCDAVINILKRVCQGTLAPHFSVRQCRYFADLLTQIIPDTGSLESKREMLCFITSKFSQLMLKVPGRNYTESTIFEPLLLKKSRYFKNFMQNQKSFVAKAVCLELSMDEPDSEDTDVGLLVNSPLQIHNSLLYKRLVVERFAKACLKVEVKVIICCDNLPEYAINIFHQHEITVLTNVLKEDIDLLEEFTQTTSVISLLDDIKEINIISLTGVEEVTIGQEQFLHIMVDRLTFKHVVVCAPTQGLCDQTALMLQKALNAMYLSFATHFESLASGQKACGSQVFDCQNLDSRSFKVQSKSFVPVLSKNYGNFLDSDFDASVSSNTNRISSLSVIPIGGTFETIMCSLLSKTSRETNSPDIREVSQVLSKTLVDVIKTLHENISLGRGYQTSRFISIKTELISSLEHGNFVHLNHQGHVCAVDHKVMLEPLETKIHILESVLNLIVQLLRIDNVISVKRV